MSDYGYVPLAEEGGPATQWEHPSGQRCVLTDKGVWLRRGEGLDADALCHLPHESAIDPDLPDATADGYAWTQTPTCCTGEDSSTCCPGPTQAESVALEAHGLVYGDRQGDYGHPREDFTRTAVLWTGLLQHKLTDGAYIEPEDIGRCMIAVKLSRDVNSPKRDNRVDMAGYAITLDRLETGK